MKRLFILFYIVVAMLSPAAYGQVKFIINAFGDTTAFERTNGCIRSVYNHDVQLEGSYEYVHVMDTVHVLMLVNMTSSTTIADPGGALVATYNPETKELTDANNYVVFKFDENNHVLNEANADIGRVEADGSVYANDNNLIGKGTGIADFKLAYLFFYCNK